MGYELIIRPEARDDLLDAFHWYQDQRQGLGFDFKLCADGAITKITRSPLIYKKVYKDVRRVVLKRFPFSVYYLVDNDRLIVLAVLHARRDPENWKSRI